MKKLWEEVEALVEVPKAAKIINRLPPGRPNAKPPGASPHYGWKMKTSSGHRMRCRNPGCDRYLAARTEDIVCSEPCRDSLRRFCEATLEVLDGKIAATDYPIDLRSVARERVKTRANR